MTTAASTPRRAVASWPHWRSVTFVLTTAVLVASGAQHAPGDSNGPATTRPSDSQLATAILAPRRQAVLSAGVASRIVTIHKELGQSISKGDPLVQFDDVAYRVGKQLAEAELASAEIELAGVEKITTAKTRQRHADAVLAAAQANLAAVQRLYEDGHASQVDLETARRDVATAQAEGELVEATAAKELSKARRDAAVARGKLELSTDELNACTLQAPFNGRVARVLANAHEQVERGKPVIEVVDDGVLTARFLLPSALFRAVRLGQELHLTITETGETVPMQITHIAAVLDPASVTFEVHASVANAAGNLRAGMNGTLRLAEVRGS